MTESSPDPTSSKESEAGQPETSPEGPEALLEGMVPGYPDAVAAIAKGQRPRKIRRALTALILSFAAATLCAEVFLRVSGYRQGIFEGTVNRTVTRWVSLMGAGIFEEIDDPVRRYAMRPGAQVELDGWTFRVNQERTRGDEIPSPKPAGEKRILALGDSFCFGLWCDEAQTLVGHLARMANEREKELGSGVHWRALNLGVPGYHTGQQLRSLEQDGLDLDPDVVLIYYNTNDIQTNGFFFDETFGLRNDYLPLPVWLRRMLWHSHLYGAIARWHYMQYQSIPSPEMDPRVPWAHVRADNQQATKASIARIVELCRDRDLPVYFVNQPLLSWMGEMQQPDWKVAPLVQWAADVCSDLDLPSTNLLGWARGYSDGVDHFKGLEPGQQPPPPDFLVDQYYADPWAEKALAWVRAKAKAQQLNWDDLPFAEQIGFFKDYPEAAPPTLDFHLNGAGYGSIARIVYPGMQAAGMLP